MVSCRTCKKGCHGFCLGLGELEAGATVGCRVCEAKAAGKGEEEGVLGAAVVSKLLEVTEERIRATTVRQQEQEREVQRLTTAVAGLEEKKELAMGPMERRFCDVLTKDVKAFRQTYASHQLTGAGIKKVLDQREMLVAVFSGTKWEQPYRSFLENFSSYHHMAMSSKPLGSAGLAKLELAVRNISIVLALDFKCRLTPKMDLLLTTVVPFARRWGCLGIFREERIESLHTKVNITKRVLACIRQTELRLFKAFQRLELKELHGQFGAVVPRGPRSEEEKRKREESSLLRGDVVEVEMAVEAREDRVEVVEEAME